MQTREIVTSFLEHGGRILILRRSGKVMTYRGLWAAVSGSIEPGEKPLEAAAREIAEETGLNGSDISLVKAGGSIIAEDESLGKRWLIRPFLFSAKTDKIRIDWEHTEFRWIEPGELSKYKTVPRLEESLRRVLEKA